MSKKKIRVYVSWCVCCHAKNATLYKLNKDLVICKPCRDDLIKVKSKDVFSREGRIVLVNGDITQPGYVPYETETKQIPEA